MSTNHVKEIRLSPEQQAVVDTWGQGMAIQAGAGAGKTSTLVVKCADLIRRKPDAKIAAVSFTERSANDLRLKLSDHFVLDAHWVTTIHGLCGKIIRDFPRESGFTGEETMLSESDSALLWERSVELLWSDTLPDEIGLSLDRLLDRETRDSFLELLERVRELELFGVLERFSLSSPEVEFSAHQDLIRVSGFVLERYRRLKERSGGLDFSDLERGATRALQNASVRKEFHKRFDLVMVDEFQDTNLLQAELMRAFARPDRSNLVVVGDPKQSIYRFRDADVTVFEAFCSEMPVRLSLTWNFRSRPSIIEFANRICSPLFEASEMAYEPLVAQRPVSEESTFQNVERFEAENPEALGTWIRSEVRRGVPLEKMALLLRKIRGNERWLQALTAQGIPLAMGSGGLFWEDPRVRELVGFLKGWVDPANTLSWMAFLRAPWVGISDEILEEWAMKQAGTRTLRDSFLESGLPLAEKLKSLFTQSDLRPASLLLAFLISDDIENEIGTQLLGLWHRAEELSARGMSFARVVDEFSRAVSEKRREKDVIPPKNLGQLLVLTVHGSKGLEFEHVILLDFSPKPARARSAPLLFWDRERGAFLGERDENGERTKESDLEKEWRTLEKTKDLAESKRLFYVALTRAQERLILVTEKEILDQAKLEKKSTSSKKEPISPLLQDYWRAWLGDFEKISRSCPIVGEQATFNSVALSAGAPVAKWERGAIYPPEFKRARHSVTDWNQLEKEEHLIELTELFQRRQEMAARVEGDVDADERMRIGTQVHKALELGELESLLEQALPIAVDALRRWYESQSDSLESYRELPFEIPIEGEVLVGAIDRVDERDDGFYLFDYKITQSVVAYRDLNAAQDWIRRYQAQLILYTWALEKLEPRARDRVHTHLVRITSSDVEMWPVDVLASHAERNEYVRGLAMKAKQSIS